MRNIRMASARLMPRRFTHSGSSSRRIEGDRLYHVLVWRRCHCNRPRLELDRKTIPVGIHNHNVALRPDQKQAWVTNNNAGTISIIDSGSNSVAKTIQTGKGLDTPISALTERRRL